MSDFCYDRPMLERIFRQAEMMDRVMERLGVEPSTAARLDRGTAWYEARTKCIGCCEERQCRSWLERSDPTPGLPPSCPNQEFFRRCLATDASTRHSSSSSPSPSPSIDGVTP